MADVFSIIDVLPLDALYLPVGSIARGSDGVTQSNHAQHPAAARDNGAVLVGRAGMKNLQMCLRCSGCSLMGLAGQKSGSDMGSTADSSVGGMRKYRTL